VLVGIDYPRRRMVLPAQRFGEEAQQFSREPRICRSWVLNVFDSALEVFTKADLPQSWAATQNNLGTALKELGTRSFGEGVASCSKSPLPLFASPSRSGPG
jgi:hypothetical protein